ncbi:molybdopterin-dependent oxidoreductase [Marinithermus hydrothermalis]|uniref:NADH-quinone oxidoreductase, chain G n=1 Tax=Marinithermus hydrothermalis (strain DSM 14884 / JCM 11576 / T1) TaxID=869210 RepID=F2NM05_MARHT|nr:molybdopterin-dependent oxidoreductase [Marinithermus hydrothermalis]AEB11262.1 NADH-quinone oxidoreductase, chain G [Marinithermus hydrothermalis DSM 14884]
MVRVKVNDREIEVPPGTSAMDAIFHAGYDVPLFCAEKYLSPTGSCRMCLVKAGAPRKGPDGDWIRDENGEVKIFWFPKLMASCTLQVSEGMVIDTLSDEVKRAQSGMVEFTLFNHPLDCPTCDKGGACELQDRSYEYGLYETYHAKREEIREGLGPELPVYTRYEFTRRHTDKHHPLSPFITLDRERCIHCKRCVRYFEEIPGDEVLDFIERGVHTFIGTADYGLPSNLTGNICDICPVGALLDQVARFRGRNWEYDRTPTTDLTDASGSAIWVDARSGRIERVRARELPETSEIWISDAARFGHEWVDLNRIKTPLVRKDGRLEPASWDEALQAMREGLKGAKKDAVGLYLAGDSTLEEGYAAAELARALGTPHLDFEGRTAVAASSFPALTYDELLEAGFALVVGDPTEELPVLHVRLQQFLKGLKPPHRYNHGTPFADLSIKERMPRQGEKLAVFAPYPTALMRWAGAKGVYRPGEEARLLQALEAALEGRSLPEGLDGVREAVRAAAERFKAAEGRVLVLGAGVLEDVEAAQAAQRIAAAFGARVFALTPAPNARGLEAVGVWPGEGGAALGEAGPQVAFYSGVEPPEDVVRAQAYRVFHLTHLTPLAERYADVVLPAETFYEKRGAMVNVEGRVLPLQPAGVDNGEAEGVVQALALFAEALGVTPPVRLVRQVRRALKERYRLDLEHLPESGVLWRPKAPRTPRALRAEAGTLYLKPSMWRHHQLQGPTVQKALGRAVLEAHPATARAHGLKDGMALEVETPYGTLEAVVRVREALPEGFLYLPAYGKGTARRVPFKLLVPQGAPQGGGEA